MKQWSQTWNSKYQNISMLPHSPIISDEAKINNETGQVYKGFLICTLFNHFVGFNPYFFNSIFNQ